MNFFLKGISFGCAYLTNFIILVDYFDKKLGLANGLTMSGSGKTNLKLILVQFNKSKRSWKFCFCATY